MFAWGAGSAAVLGLLMFFVSENDSAANLTGTYNVVLYNAIKETSNGGSTIDDWEFMAGNGAVTFDGAAGRPDKRSARRVAIRSTCRSSQPTSGRTRR